MHEHTPQTNETPASTNKEVIKKYRLTLVAAFFSILTFTTAINFVPIMFMPIMDFSGSELSIGHMGLLIFISFLAQMVILLSCSKLPDKLGLRPVLIVTCSVAAVGFLLLFLVPIMLPNALLSGLIIAVIVYGVAAGFLATMLNPIVNNLPFKNKEKTLTLLHVAFALGLIISIVGITVPIYFLPGGAWNYIPLVAIAIPVTAGLLWLKAPIVQPKKDNAAHANLSGSEKTLLKPAAVKKPNYRLLAIFLLSMAAAMASEAIISKGSSAYIDAGLGVPKIVGDLLGPTMFALCLGIGRLLYGFLGSKRSMHGFMIAGSAACFVLYLVAVFTPVPALGVAAIALVGFATCVLVPGMMAKTGQKFSGGGVMVFVFMSAAGKVGAAGGPALFGMLADVLASAFPNLLYNTGLSAEAFGLRAALLLCAVFPLASVVLQILFKRSLKKDNARLSEMVETQ